MLDSSEKGLGLAAQGRGVLVYDNEFCRILLNANNPAKKGREESC